jgi:NAD(P)-dependent dehydrogenase (short-subunit alcohol dehydrogenase family)
MGELSGKVAVVTGGSRGIGLAIADGLARAGADVVIASRKLDACEGVARKLAAEHGVRALPVAFHAAKWDDCDRLAETVDREFGRGDVLVNNAGMSPRYPALPAIDEAYYDKVSGVNLKGPFRLSILLAEQMTACDGGSIVNISTIGSLRPGADELVYACAKAGLNALTVGLAEAYAPKVRVNAILPGPFRTDITKAWPPAALDGSFVPLGRLGEPGEVAPLAVHLASAASSYTTGAIIRVDGGVTRKV